MPRQEKERIDKQVSKQETLEERLGKTRRQIIKTFKDRRKSEKDFLEVIKKQKEYWKGQLKNTDPQEDKDRYDELNEKIKNEEKLIKQIKDEIDRIDNEIKQEKEHEWAEEKTKEH